MVEITKLDAYDYILLPGVIRIKIDGTTDPILVDIMSEVQNSNDLIFVEDSYYSFIGEYEIFKELDLDEHYLELKVVEIMPDRIDDILNTRR